MKRTLVNKPMNFCLPIFFSVMLSMISFAAFAQPSDSLHYFDNRDQEANIRELIDTATSNMVGFVINDIQTPLGNYTDLFYNVAIQLRHEALDVEKLILQNKHRLLFNFEVKGIDAQTNTITTYADTASLTIDPRTDLDQLFFQFNRRNYAPFRMRSIQEVTLQLDLNTIDTSATFWSSVWLALKVEFSRYELTSNTGISPRFYSQGPTNPNSLKENEATIYWDYTSKPSFYELEWVHIPNSSPSAGQTIAVDFTKNAVRTQTGKNYLPFNLLYTPGYLVVRGRSIRPSLNQDTSAFNSRLEFSDWSLNDQASLNSSNDAVLIIDHDTYSALRQLNWQYTATYANNSRKKEVVNYFDGSQRGRQTSTLLNNTSGRTYIDANDTSRFIPNQSTVISQENYYDYNGQAVLSLLPSPIISADKIGFQDSINLVLTTGAPDERLLKSAYDEAANTTIPEFTTTSDGVAQYYSPNNQLLSTDAKTAFLPKAEGYPYQRTEYMKDGSGRVKALYGLGKEKALDNTKGTRFAYAKPTQPELEQLFGTNVGLANFYKKDISIDPNGVMNMSYINQKGQTVATSIAGISEARADLQDIPADTIYFTTDLMQSGADQFLAQEGSYELTYPIFVTAASVYEFEYGFDIEPYLACSNVSVCFDCRYQLTFQIVDEDNQLVLEAKDLEIEFDHNSCLGESYVMDQLTTFLPSSNASVTNGKVSVELSAQKQYTIVKKLSLLTNELEVDAQYYLVNSACDFKDLAYFEAIELDSANFEECETTYDFTGDNVHCIAIREGLKADFTRPNGGFVKGALDSDLILPYIYNKLLELPGCNDLSVIGLLGFETDALHWLGISDTATFSTYKSEYLDFFIHYHPTYCQLNICEQYYTKESLQFEALLKKSKTAEEFTAMAKTQKYIPPSFSGYKFTANDLLAYELTGVDQVADTILVDFDPLMQYFIGDSLIESYSNLVFLGDSLHASYSDTLNLLVRDKEECDYALPISSRSFYKAYFESFARGCRFENINNPNLLDSIGIGELAKAMNQGSLDDFEEIEDPRWEYYRSLYLSARESLLEDVISSIVCTKTSRIIPDTTDGVPGYDTTYILPRCSGPGSAYHPNYSLYHAKLYYNASYFIGTGGAVANVIGKGVVLQDYEDSLKEVASSVSTSMGNELFALLLSDGRILATDSADFVDRIDSSQLACNPHTYLETLANGSGRLFVIGNIWEVNLLPSLKPFLQYYQDQNGNSLFTCSTAYEEKYTCQDFNTLHQNFVTAFGAAAVPTLSSAADIDINDVQQKVYGNWMNWELGLNLGFRYYYEFAQNCTENDSITVFGDTVFIDGTDEEKALREAIVRLSNNDVLLSDLDQVVLVDSIQNRVTQSTNSVYNRLDITYNYYRFGEMDWSNNQNSLYFTDESFSNTYGILDTITTVASLLVNSINVGQNVPIEDKGELVFTEKLSIAAYSPIIGMPNLLIDRAYQYSDGTVWVRLLNASDSSYSNDYYYYYEPYNGAYLSNELPSYFESATPLFDQKELHYLNLGFQKGNLNLSILFKSARRIGQSSQLPAVELSDIQGSAEFPLDQTCGDLKYEIAMQTAKRNYLDYLDGIKDSFKLEYQNFCLNRNTTPALSNQSLNMSYLFTERQFTLYYYDQANNLVRTVPPSGIDVDFNLDSLQSDIDLYRSLPNTPVEPNHSKATTYRYNSTNQIIEQTTPNGGTSQFWYDKAGRLTLSQNAEQDITHKYSYTLYDEQSRIDETGETTLGEFAPLEWGEIHAQIVLDKVGAEKESLTEVIRKRTRTDVSKTFYDAAVLMTSSYSFSQENLRSRVATQAYYARLDSGASVQNWDYATHYSYDATGNVKTLLNDYYQNGTITNEYQRFKRLDYAFDVISGNVLQVYYQLGFDDAFYHRYEYDAENRITKVETSTDGIIWDEDAHYDYYLHGPLARTELGEHKVQGIDYSYTLDGWLKAVNAGHHQADMGQDATKDNVFAADAFGFALNYHQNDYQSIGDMNALLIGAQTDTVRSDLYNGNIGAITKHNQSRTIGNNYQYDQLNRLRSMQEYAVDVDSLKWENGFLTDGNSSFYEYDKSGNLTSLHRFDGASGQTMDQLSYNYLPGKDQLSSVNDAVEDSLFSNDIDNQLIGNYSYDQIGNLEADTAEGICQIQWYPNGKVKKIRRDHPIRERADLYFEYDASGNRVKKVMSFEEDERTFRRATYYVRDAQGNVMATYEERDCDYFAADDSTGEFYYQYGETFGYYTGIAVQQTSRDAVLNFLGQNFSQKEALCEQAYLNLHFIPNIRDSIFVDLNDTAYLQLYPEANQRVVALDAFAYAKELFENDSANLINITNYQNEAYINYLRQHNKVADFYNSLDQSFASHGVKSASQDFMNMNMAVLQPQVNNSSFIRQYLNLTAGQYNTVLASVNDGALAMSNMQTWVSTLETKLSSQVSNIVAEVKPINALLLLRPFSAAEIATIFSGINMNSFYNAAQWIPSYEYQQLVAILYHVKIRNAALVDLNQLGDYPPSISMQWTTDVDGDLLEHYLHTEHAGAGSVKDISALYFATENIHLWDTYFSDTNTVYPYVQLSLEQHWNHDALKAVVLTLDSLTRARLYLTEDLAHLTNYYKEEHPARTLLQNFYYDSLSVALSGLAHTTPYDYANELSENLGVNFGPVGGCNPHVVYLLPEQYMIYGSSRLGVMDAKQRRKDAENQYSRKLGAKNYELSDHLGNVVATISDKKLHPLEMLTNGNYGVDTSLGFQADVTGRYEYYPFGMEIMDRSGDFSEIDYTKDVFTSEYEGLLSDCADYYYASGVVNDPNLSMEDRITVHCETSSNVYGQNYVTSFSVTDSLIDQMIVRFYANLQELIPDLETDAEYQLEIHLGQVSGRKVAGRVLSASPVIIQDGLSLSMGLELPSTQVIASPDRVVIFNGTGSEFQEWANANGDIWLHVNTIPQHTWRPEFTKGLSIEKIKVSKVMRAAEVHLAKRENKAYKYGFNGQERMDEISGSGNVVDHDGERMQDTRLGRTFKMDRQAASFPWISPYSFAADNPIAFIDPDGEKIRWFASKGVWKYRKALLATPTGREVWNNMRKTATKINVQVTDKVLVVEAGDRLFVTEGVTFNAGNLNNNGGEFSYDEATVYVSLGTQKLKNAVAANAGVDNFEDLNFKQKAEGIRSEIGTGNYDVYNADAESTVESDAYGTVSIANDPYGGEIDVATPLQGESESEYTGRVGGHEGVHSYKDAKIEGSQQRYSRGKRQLNKEKAAYGKERGIINEQRSNRRNK